MCQKDFLGVEVEECEGLHGLVCSELKAMRLPGNLRTLERLAMHIIWRSYDPKVQSARITCDIAKDRIDALKHEEGKGDDPFLAKFEDCLATWYQQGPHRWQEDGGIFDTKERRWMKRAVDTVQRLFREQRGCDINKTGADSIETVLGITDNIQKKL